MVEVAVERPDVALLAKERVSHLGRLADEGIGTRRRDREQAGEAGAEGLERVGQWPI